MKSNIIKTSLFIQLIISDYLLYHFKDDIRIILSNHFFNLSFYIQYIIFFILIFFIYNIFNFTDKLRKIITRNIVNGDFEIVLFIITIPNIFWWLNQSFNICFNQTFREFIVLSQILMFICFFFITLMINSIFLIEKNKTVTID